MQSPEIRVMGLIGLPEIVEGDDLSRLIVRAVGHSKIEIQGQDVFVVAQKVVSKAEGRTVRLDARKVSPRARAWAETYEKDPQCVEVVLNEARRIVRMEKGVLVAETEQGYVCANAGVDASNVPAGVVTLLPQDPDRSAAKMREALEQAFGVPLGVIVADTVGRPWREGIVNIALGVAGLSPFLDYRGQRDSFGKPLETSLVAAADELASAAELVMGKTRKIPVALVRGFHYHETEGAGREMIRPPERDLFR